VGMGCPPPHRKWDLGRGPDPGPRKFGRLGRSEYTTYMM